MPYRDAHMRSHARRTSHYTTHCDLSFSYTHTLRRSCMPQSHHARSYPASSSRTQRRQIRLSATENNDLAAFLKSNGNLVPPGLQTANSLLHERSASTLAEPSTSRRPGKRLRREISEPPGVSDLCMGLYYSIL
jgi:hypothetical protein